MYSKRFAAGMLILILGVSAGISGCGTEETIVSPAPVMEEGRDSSSPAPVTEEGREGSSPTPFWAARDVVETELRQEKRDVEESKLHVPGLCTAFFVSAEGVVTAWDYRSEDINLYYCGGEGNRKTPGVHPVIQFQKRYGSVKIKKMISRDNGDYLILTNKNVIRVNSNGKEKYCVNIPDLLRERAKRWNAEGLAQTAYNYDWDLCYIGKGKALVQVWDEDEYLRPWSIFETQTQNRLCLVDLKEKKVEWEYEPNLYLCALADEGYAFVEMQNGVVGKLELQTGDIVASYSTDEIFGTGQQRDDMDLDGAFYFRDYPLTYTSYNGVLYAKYLTGIFRLDEEEREWVQILDGEKDFALGATYGNCFEFTSENECYLMGSSCDDECATDFCRYTFH